MRAYRDEFESQGTLDAPHALLTLSVIVADTQAEVERQTASFMVNIAQALTSQRVRLLDPEEAKQYAFTPRERAIAESFKAKLIAGTPEVVKSRIDELATRTGADEVMVSTMVYDFAARKRSLELLAEAFDLSAAPAPAGRGA
jgi:alkanesulfonate monooxygenase SsuD/methylene tetrahydromethanopterin reductase-like flavin-dependent oxidoreductase (luciferase family)